MLHEVYAQVHKQDRTRQPNRRLAAKAKAGTHWGTVAKAGNHWRLEARAKTLWRPSEKAETLCSLRAEAETLWSMSWRRRLAGPGADRSLAGWKLADTEAKGRLSTHLTIHMGFTSMFWNHPNSTRVLTAGSIVARLFCYSEGFCLDPNAENSHRKLVSKSFILQTVISGG